MWYNIFMNKSQIKVLYFILWRVMDIESLLWDIASFIIKPVAILRKIIINKLAKLQNITNEK